MMKTRELFNTSTTNECRLWYWNMKNDSHWYITLSDLKETVAGACSFNKEENRYLMWESVLNAKMV